MPQHVSPAKWAKILSSIRDEGIGIMGAAKAHSIPEAVIKTLLVKQVRKERIEKMAIHRLKQESMELKAIIKNLRLRRERR